MKSNILKELTCMVIVIVLAFVTFPTNIFAAGSYSASLGSTSIYVGKSTSVIIKTTRAAGKFTVSSSNPSVASVNGSTTWVDGSMDNAISVKGVSKGKATITITPVNVSDDEYNLITTSKSITITVKEKATVTPTPKPNTDNEADKETEKEEETTKKSSDATLASLTTKVGSLNFKSGTYKYTVNVDKTVKSLGLKATASDSKATVKITGDENFKVGNNIVKVTVTAEDGTVKTYEITVVKSKYGSGPLKDLKIKGYALTPNFDPSDLKYSVEVGETEKLDIEYTLTDKDSTVVIEGNDNLKVGENTIKIIVTEKDGTVTTYEIQVTMVKSPEEVVESNNNIWIIIIVILAVLVIGEAVYIVIKKKNK